jgi:hypothetical protein
VLRGGYLSWRDPVSNHWWQEIYFGSRREYRDLGVFDASAGSIRSWVDAQTEHPGIDKGLKKSNATLKAAVASGRGTEKSASSIADAWRSQIKKLQGRK